MRFIKIYISIIILMYALNELNTVSIAPIFGLHKFSLLRSPFPLDERCAWLSAYSRLFSKLTSLTVIILGDIRA